MLRGLEFSNGYPGMVEAIHRRMMLPRGADFQGSEFLKKTAGVGPPWRSEPPDGGTGREA